MSSESTQIGSRKPLVIRRIRHGYASIGYCELCQAMEHGGEVKCEGRSLFARSASEKCPPEIFKRL